ncbi:hypothetical protein [Pluralibacter sp.]|uniref:hypothetical protein n=1 Tax=Pluralibacter sp. TaxID=1920032 RepID=UPI0025E67729|nr:hypothetical protein [Pluralibacter sp.]MBV8044509.1 hypothetical protein [Pluralibacter sp.]
MSNDKGCCGICADCVPQIDGGSGFHNCADAHAAQLAEDKAVLNDQPLTDSELTRLIWGLKAEGFHQRLLAGLIELQEHREAAKPLTGIDLESAVDRLAENRDKTRGARSTSEQIAFYDGYRAGAEAGLNAPKLPLSDAEKIELRARVHRTRQGYES